jgi:hypothetical protein
MTVKELNAAYNVILYECATLTVEQQQSDEMIRFIDSLRKEVIKRVGLPRSYFERIEKEPSKYFNIYDHYTQM